MSCRAWEELLQRHLDGEAPADALEQHFAHCAECASQRPTVRRLLVGLALLHPPTPPAGLQERLSVLLLAQTAPPRSPWSRYLPLAGLAAAAALLVALGLLAWWPGGDRSISPAPPDGSIARPNPTATPTEPLRSSMAEASTAVASLTSRTASETMDRTSTLLPLVRQTALEPLTPMTAPMDPPLEPIREATEGISAGLAPVADSARRAVGLFLRDLPMGRPADKNPG